MDDNRDDTDDTDDEMAEGELDAGGWMWMGRSVRCDVAMTVVERPG